MVNAKAQLCSQLEALASLEGVMQSEHAKSMFGFTLSGVPGVGVASAALVGVAGPALSSVLGGPLLAFGAHSGLSSAPLGAPELPMASEASCRRPPIVRVPISSSGMGRPKALWMLART